MSENPKKIFRFQLVTVMSCFFVMGSISMVGISSNYLKAALHLSDAKANLLPSLVYIWFLICTVPTDMLMERIGRKRTVIISMSVLILSLFMPLFMDNYSYMLVCFILLGISNVCLQSSMYPLFSSIIDRERLAHHFTMGELVKTISGFVAPYIATFGSLYCVHFFGLSWRVLFLVYLIIAIVSITMVLFMPVDKVESTETNSDFLGCFRLMKHPFILVTFIAVMCHVGIDIGANTIAPKIMMHRLNYTLATASFAVGVYFMARLAGGYIWTVVIDKISKRRFFYLSTGIILAGMVMLLMANDKLWIYCCIAMVGFGNAALFPILLSVAVMYLPEQKNKISVLMIMGQFGGALFPYAMGLALDYGNLETSLSVLMIGVIYLIFFTLRFTHYQNLKI